jgi:uncharacterized protein
MKKLALQFARLFIGLFLYALGIVMTINANLGLAPWDVFHQGMSKVFGITMGQASITVGVVIVILDAFMGERLGWGTLLNMIFIGIFMDLLMLNSIIPVFESTFLSLLMMAMGMFIIGVASYYYIGAGLGSGPRDGLMVALTKKTGKSVRFVRNSIEVAVLGVGYFLGGTVGLGTLITALSIGYFVQFAFKIFKFNVKEVKHRFIDEDIKTIKEKLLKKKEDVEAES